MIFLFDNIIQQIAYNSSLYVCFWDGFVEGVGGQHQMRKDTRREREGPKIGKPGYMHDDELKR